MMFIDRKVIQWTEKGYNILWDYWGITKGIIMLLLTLINAIVNISYIGYSSFDKFTLLITCIFFLFCLFLHNRQKRGSYAFINSLARNNQTFLGLLCRIFFINLYVFIFYRLPDMSTFSNMSYIIIVFYLSCVQVRERQPPEEMSFSFNPA